MLGMPGQLGGRPEPRGAGRELVEIDVAGRGEQGQPASGYEQAPMLGERLLRVDQPGDVRQVLTDSSEQLGRWCTGVGHREIVNGLLQQLQSLRAHVAGRRPLSQFQRVGLIVTPGSAPGPLVGCERQF